MNQWLSILVAIVFLLSCGLIYSGVLTYFFGRFVYGRLWRPVRVTVPAMQFHLVEMFVLILLLSTAIALSQTIWPVIEESPCTVAKLPQRVVTEITLQLSPRDTIRSVANLEIVDRVIIPAFPCGAAIFSWLLGTLMVQANRIERTLDRLLLRLFVAPLGTMCIVFIPTLVSYYLVDLATVGDRLPSVDAMLWHGVVLVGGCLLGTIYCRSISGWIVLRMSAVSANDSAASQDVATGIEVSSPNR